MNDLKVFQNEEFGKVRVFMQDGEPWFVGKDVAIALGYTNPQKAIRDHVFPEDKTVNESFTVNGTAPSLVNESGMYSLILSSKLPSAKKFKRWVTHDILPSIARTGKYENPDSPKTNDTITIDYNTLTTIASVFTAETVKALLPYLRKEEPAPKAEPPKAPRTRRPVLLKDFCDLLKEVKKDQCLSNREIARRVGVHETTITKWKNEGVRPTAEHYLKFVMEFNIPVTQLGEGVFD